MKTKSLLATATYVSLLLAQQAMYCRRLTRRDLRILIGTLTDHVDLNRHLSLMKVRSDPTCPLCQDEEDTALHLLMYSALL